MFFEIKKEIISFNLFILKPKQNKKCYFNEVNTLPRLLPKIKNFFRIKSKIQNEFLFK